MQRQMMGDAFGVIGQVVAAKGQGTTVSGIQAQCDAAIAVKMMKLGQLDAEFGSAGNVTADHRAGLESTISATESNLASHKTQIDALKAAGKNMVVAEADLAKMNTYIDASQADVAGRVDSLIALTPATVYDAKHNVVNPFRTSASKAEIADGHAACWGARTAAAIIRLY